MNNKINGLPPASLVPDALLNAAKRNSEGSGTSVPGLRDGDRLELTSSARLLSDTVNGSDSAPVDVQRVAHLREAIANGTYRVNADRIAQRLLDVGRKDGE